MLADEWDPAWTASGDLVTRFSSSGPDQFLRRTRGPGDPMALAETTMLFLEAVSDRPDAALIGFSYSPDNTSMGFSLVPWDGAPVKVDKPPTAMLTTGVERITSTSGDRIDTEVLEGSGEEKGVVVWQAADGRRFPCDLVGDERNAWFDVAWTRGGVDALATSRDRVRLLALRDGELDERVLARLPDLGRGRRWSISVATDDQVVLTSWEQDRTGIVSLVDDDEPVRWIDGVPVGAIPD